MDLLVIVMQYLWYAALVFFGLLLWTVIFGLIGIGIVSVYGKLTNLEDPEE